MQADGWKKWRILKYLYCKHILYIYIYIYISVCVTVSVCLI